MDIVALMATKAGCDRLWPARFVAIRADGLEVTPCQGESSLVVVKACGLPVGRVVAGLAPVAIGALVGVDPGVTALARDRRVLESRTRMALSASEAGVLSDQRERREIVVKAKSAFPV